MIQPFRQRVTSEAWFEKKWLDHLDKNKEELEREPVEWWSKEERVWLEQLRQLNEAYDAATAAANEAEKVLEECRVEVDRQAEADRQAGDQGAGTARTDPCEKESNAYTLAAQKADAAWEAVLRARDAFFKASPHRAP